jgi:competence protein ComGD
MYLISTGSKQLVVRHHSPTITVTQGTIQLVFKFNPNGNVDRFGTLYIRTQQKNYRLTLLIGKGRFYVMEE